MRSVQTDLWCVPLHQPSPRLLTSVTTSPSCSSTSYSELAGNGTMHLQMIHFQRSDVLYKNFQFPSFFIDKDDFQQLKWFKTCNLCTELTHCLLCLYSPVFLAPGLGLAHGPRLASAHLVLRLPQSLPDGLSTFAHYFPLLLRRKLIFHLELGESLRVSLRLGVLSLTSPLVLVWEVYEGTLRHIPGLPFLGLTQWSIDPHFLTPHYTCLPSCSLT